MTFFAELKRRNVFRVAVAYAAAAWLLMQITDLVLENIGAPDWVMQVFMLALAVGFPLAIIVSWAFEVTPDGIKLEGDVDRSKSISRTTGRQLNRGIIMILSVAIVFLLTDRFREQTGFAGITHQQSIAVLPFIAMSNGPDDGYFADGLSEEILNSLAQLPELLVTARTSAFHFKDKQVPVQEIADALGVQHIVEGSIRRSGEQLRVTAQLIRAEDGFHLWSEIYDSTSTDTIAVQQDIAEKIADAMDVVMDDKKREVMHRAGLRDVEAYIAYQKGMDIYDKAHGQADQFGGLQRANEYFEIVLERVPDFAPAYVDHSDIYFHILLDDTINRTIPGVTEERKADAFRNAEKNLTASVQYARSPIERHNAELDLAFLNGNWRGITGRIQQVLNDSGCAESNWLSPLVAVFGYAKNSLARQRQYRACNPLFSTTWFNEARILLWALDAPAALDIVRQGDKVAPGNWLNLALIMALVANNKFDQADDVIVSRLQDTDIVLVNSLMVMAARGDSERVAVLLEGLRKETKGVGFWETIVHSWAGDRKTANSVAAQIDRHPAGHMSLTLAAYWCACGAPWDLSVTPNFAATIREAGLSWPPASPITFPLKNW